jgi:SNF2 family DNA or RNA helicase
MEPIVIGNTAKQRRDAFADACARMHAGQPTVVVCHYEALPIIAKQEEPHKGKSDGWAKLGRWDLVVADEAHRLKNGKTGFVKSLQKIDAVGKLLMSGSVLDGNFEDLFVPWKMMCPARYRSKWRDWNDRFGDYAEGGFGRISLGVKPHRLDALRDELGDLLVVRRAADELDIPAPHVTRLSVDMLPAQVKVYEQLRDELLADLPDGSLVSASAGASLVQALRVVTGGVPTEGGGYESAKLDALCGRLEDIGRQQVVVFGWHRELVERACERLSGAFSVAYVHGGVGGTARERIVSAFRAGRTQMLCATMGTLSESVNLQNAGRVVLLEHSWRPLDNEQAVNRVVRQGQQVHAAVDHVTCAGTVDEIRVLPVNLSKTLLRQLLIGR